MSSPNGALLPHALSQGMARQLLLLVIDAAVSARTMSVTGYLRHRHSTDAPTGPVERIRAIAGLAETERGNGDVAIIRTA